jgi:hypothetical protein
MSPTQSLRNYWYDEIKARMARDTEARGEILVRSEPAESAEPVEPAEVSA